MQTSTCIHKLFVSQFPGLRIETDLCNLFFMSDFVIYIAKLRKPSVK